MSLSAAALSKLAEFGLTMQQVIEFAAVLDSEKTPTESAVERKKRLARERTERWRASQNVTDRHLASQAENVTTASQSVTERHETSPLARVEDNLSRLVLSGDLTTLHDAWASGGKTGREALDALQAEFRLAAGKSLNATSPRLISLAPILGLSRDGRGPACDLEADVLQAIRARGAKAAPGSVSSWDYFVPAICEARDRRLAGAPEVGAVIPFRSGSGPPSTISDRLGEEEVEARRRAFALLDAQNG